VERGGREGASERERERPSTRWCSDTTVDEGTISRLYWDLRSTGSSQ
jgi:hypothetical protein